jgi:hypothetical protein
MSDTGVSLVPRLLGRVAILCDRLRIQPWSTPMNPIQGDLVQLEHSPCSLIPKTLSTEDEGTRREQGEQQEADRTAKLMMLTLITF